MLMRKRIIGLLAAAVTLTVITAPAATATVKTAAKKSNVITLLNSLPVEPEITTGYNRSDFKHWITQPNGCDTRKDVLIRDRKQGTIDGCGVMNGKWISLYDGVVTTNPSTFDIDHMVPLSESYGSGAAYWSADQREAFANDMGYKPSLIAVSASSNRSKSDRDPAEWMPPLKSDWCTYLKAWVGVKYRWSLTVDKAEKAAIKRDLSTQKCGLKMKTPPVAAVAN